MAKVMLSLPDEFLAKVDSAADKEHRTRSELIREALRWYLEGGKDYRIPADDPVVADSFGRLRSVTWRGRFDSTREIRGSRDTRRR